jgi:hypothetical protein
MEELIPLLTAFGLGSIVTALVQSWTTRRAHIADRSFDERKAAYIGLLEAYEDAAVGYSDAAAKRFAYWQVRCDLVAPKAVRDAAARIVATNDDPTGRNAATNALIEAMRADLGVAIGR